jgi:hypothetical protein
VTITGFGARALVQPLPKPALDFRVCCTGMAAAEVLAHQVHAGLEEIERRAKGLCDAQ